MRHGAGIIAIQGGKVLLVKARQLSKQVNGSIAFPGGRIEGNETAETTAKREFEEETGLITEELIDFPGNYVEALVPTKKGDLKISFKVFLSSRSSGTLRSTDETEPFWVDIEEARKMKLLGKNNEVLEKALKYLNKP